jgi:hypothetical protein
MIDGGEKEVVAAKTGYCLGVREGVRDGEDLQVGADLTQSRPAIYHLGLPDAGGT